MKKEAADLIICTREPKSVSISCDNKIMILLIDYFHMIKRGRHTGGNCRDSGHRSREIRDQPAAIIVSTIISILMVSILYAGACAASPESGGRPGPPLDLAAETGDGFVILSWNPPGDSGDSPVSGYMVYRGPAADMLYSLGLIGNVTTYNDNTVENGKTYYYSVSAINAQGEGSRSAAISVTPVGVPDPPSSVKAVKDVGFVRITWGKPAHDGGMPVLNYLIYRGFSPYHLSLYATMGNTTFSYTDGNVSNGHVYYYMIVALNEVGEGQPSDIVSADFITEERSYDVYIAVGVVVTAAVIILVFMRRSMKH